MHEVTWKYLGVKLVLSNIDVFQQIFLNPIKQSPLNFIENIIIIIILRKNEATRMFIFSWEVEYEVQGRYIMKF